MLRLSEIGFFLVPFAVYGVWVFLGANMPRWTIWVAVGVTLVMAAATVWFGITNAIPPDEVYTPAHMENGALVPGHGGPRH